MDAEALDLRPAHQPSFHAQGKHTQAQRPRRIRACYNPKNRHKRTESERFKSFSYEELTKRDKVNLDIFWLKDEALEESANLPAPEVIAADVTADLEAALEQFATIAEELNPKMTAPGKCTD